MKFKYLIVFFVFFIVIGAVSAAENTTDTQTADDINVTVPDKMYHEDLADIEVDLSENASGYIRASVDDVEIYNEKITEKHIKIPIVIPEPKGPVIVPNRPVDHTSHSLSVFYNDINVKSSVFMVMKFNQSEDYHGGIPDEILKDDDSYQHISLIFPSSANGTVEIYIDGVLKEKLNTTRYVFLNNTLFSSLDFGNHTVRIIYSGDDYYLPSDRTFNFTVVDMLIHIPSAIVLDHDDCITAKTLKHTDGEVSLYVDSKLVKKSKLDKYGEFLYSMFDVITCGDHEVELRYAAPGFTKSKKANVTVSYVVDIDSFGVCYGDENSVVIIVPPDMDAKLIKISVDGVIRSFEIDDSGWIEIDTSKLVEGNHTVTFDFKGNGKYYSQSLTYNFTIIYYIKMPEWYSFYSTGSEVSFTLPDGAKGSLDVFINNTLYKSVKMSHGYALVKLDGLECGNYLINASYSGSDYDVKSQEAEFNVIPKVTAPYSMVEGEDRFITAYVSSSSTGKVIFRLNDKDYEAEVVKGKASMSLKKIKPGEYDVEVIYINANGEEFTSYDFILIEKAQGKISGAKDITCVYASNTKYSVKITKDSKVLKNVWVTFKFGKKTVKVKTNSKGIASVSVPKLAPGKYQIKVVYKNVNTVKKMTVKHVLSLKSVKIKKSAKKLVLTVKTKKTLKGKTVKFKFAKKTYTAKVSKKGIAKVIISKSVLKKLKVGKTVTYKATYLKDTVTKTAKVKK